MAPTKALLGALLVVGCRLDDYTDPDGDGVPFPEDCDSTDPSVLGPALSYLDLDGDGYGDPALSELSCVAVEGWVSAGTDCDDSNAQRSPGAAELCNGRDDDCDGLVDDADDSISGDELVLGYADEDLDGYGHQAIYACPGAAGLVEAGGDCDDQDPQTHPGVREQCGDGADNNCSGRADPLCSLPQTGTTVDAWSTWTGPAGSAAGADLAVGDVDGDGRDDFLAGGGATGSDASGAAWLVYGGEGDGVLSAAPGWEGSAPLLALGSAVALADLDGDGFDEVILGASGRDELWLISGGAGRLSGGRAPDETLWGPDGTSFGYALSSLGDLDGDGRDDVAVSAYHGADGAGSVTVISGGESASVSEKLFLILEGEAAHDAFGARPDAVAAGDGDGDGAASLLVGAPTHDSASANEGRVYVFDVSAGEALSSADAATLDDLGGVEEGYFGSAILVAGDLNGDGYDELVVSAPWNGAGVVSVRAGGVGGWGEESVASLEGEAHLDGFGTALASGDIDDDGVPDLLVSAPEHGLFSGRVYVFSGAFLGGGLTAAEASNQLSGDAEHYFGSDLALADPDGIGAPAVLVGSESADTIYLFHTAGL